MEGTKSTIDNTDLVSDWISSLPDSILGHILSFLSTKEAVATTVLSKRWKFAWVTVHDLDFYYVDSLERPRTDDENLKFIQFVDRVLLLHDGGSLNKFSLEWHICAIASYVSSWINIAITRNVHELYLSLGDGEMFYMPISGFNCDSLQSLELNDISFVCDAIAVCLPRLEKLKLNSVNFESTEACGKLISGCPMLQNLYLDIYCWDDDDVEELDMPLSVFTCDSLQSLELKGNISVPAAIVVCLPRLEKLKLNRGNFESTEACGKLISGCLMLQKLYLDIYSVDDYEVEELDMPLSVFTCDSLQSLELKGHISVPAAIVVYLPRLEKLKLDRVNFESKESCEKLIRGCPMLQDLCLDFLSFTHNGDDDDDDDECFTCIISSASLRRLAIYFKKTSCLKLEASSLESFKARGGISDIYVEKSLCSLVQADFSVTLDGHDLSNNSIVEAVRAFNCAKVLTLSTDVMWALSRATISLSTEFTRLVKLVAGSYCTSLQDVIQSSDNLESLIIQHSVDDVYGHSKWTTPVEVPRCLSNSLKKVKFYDYKGLEGEREMIRYMLKNGSALEVMQISCYIKGDGEKLKLLQDISEFPRKSPVCIVQFSRHPWKRQLLPLF